MEFNALVILCICWRIVSGYDILVIIPTTFFSHYAFIHEISKALAIEGHNITVASPIKLKKSINNYEEVYLEDLRNDQLDCVYISNI